MMSSEALPAPSTARPVQDLIGIAENVTFSADPAALFRELLVAAGMTLRNPAGVIAANTRLLWGYAGAFRAAGERAIGRDNPSPIAIARGDKRFADPAYQQNPAYFLLAQQYLLFSRLVDELLDTAGVSGSREAKARFIAKFLVDALAPTNTLAGNPAALRKAFDTGGKSIVNGLKNWVHDLRHNGGWPSQVDRSGFEVGVNMAATPGSVVYRSDLIELIQYSPQTPETYAVPLLFCPPWINKFYIMDLAPGKSLIEWAVQHGHTCFAISYRNPDTDFSQPGLFGTFTDEATVAGLEKQMRKTGFLDSATMARTFSALRSNDLIFQYVGNNWLQGNKPPSFDLLAWNEDSTRMPARMHSEYLRACYLRNEFARGEFEIDGNRLDPGLIDVDSYVLAAVDDHIVPWTSGYKTTQLFGGKRRFVLSSSGHIAGIVNPPNPKAKHWVNDSLPADPHEWKANADLVNATWWQDWTAWIAERGGEMVPAPDHQGSDDYPPVETAPGSYVRAT